MKLLTALTVVVLGVCLAILYYVRKERPGEVAFVPMSISFEDEEYAIGDHGPVPPATVSGFDYGN